MVIDFFAVQKAFKLLKDNLSSDFPHPTVLILTASRLKNEDLSSEIDLIQEKMMQVDAITFNEEENAQLLSLTGPFGHLFASELIKFNQDIQTSESF